MSGLGGLAFGCTLDPRAIRAPLVARNLSQDTTMIALPAIPRPAGQSVEDVIARRRSVREYADAPVSLGQLANILHCADGVTDPNLGLRAAPSAGALYPIDIYVCASSVAGLAPGVYRYVAREHALAPRYAGDVSQQLYRAALSQTQIRDAALVLALIGVPARLESRYRDRSERYMLLEAGHIGQNVYLETTALGLGCCAVGAFQDDTVKHVLGVAGDTDRALYLLAVGPLSGE